MDRWPDCLDGRWPIALWAFALNYNEEFELWQRRTEVSIGALLVK